MPMPVSCGSDPRRSRCNSHGGQICYGKGMVLYGKISEIAAIDDSGCSSRKLLAYLFRYESLETPVLISSSRNASFEPERLNRPTLGVVLGESRNKKTTSI